MNELELDRQDALRDRLRSWSGDLLEPLESRRLRELLTSDRRRFRFLIRLVVGAISAVSGALLFYFFDQLQIPAPELSAAATCAAAATLARVRWGWRHTGAEEGWTLAAGWLLVLALPSSMRTPETELLLFASATAVAGRIARAPLLFGLTSILFLVWIESRWVDSAAVVTGGLAALAASLVRARRTASPLVETSWSWIQLATAASAALFGLETGSGWFFCLGVGALLLALGYRNRDTVDLWASFPLLAAAGYELGTRWDLPREWKLLVGGIGLIAASIALERALRQGWGGWTSRPVRGDSEFLDLAGAAVLTPSHEAATTAEDGGDFGGGGATERY